MAKEQNILHLYAYGDIYNAQGADSEEYGIISLSGIMRAFKKGNGEAADAVLLHIHTYGGDLYESLAIFDYLKQTGKEINTIVEGVCASAGTVLLLAGKKRIGTANSKLLAHSPWTFAVGNADDMEEMTARLRADENQLLDFYERHTGYDRDKMLAMMQEERFLTAEDAQEFGFFNEVLTDVVEARARIFNKSRIQTIYNKKTENIMADETKALSLVDRVLAAAKELVSFKAETPEPEKAPEPQTETVTETTEVTKEVEVPQVDPKDAEIEKLKAELAAEKAEKEKTVLALTKAENGLTEAEKAMALVKTTFVPQARTNSFEKVGVEKEGQEIDLKERMKARKAANK